MAVYGLMGWNGPGDMIADGLYFYPHDDRKTRNAFFASAYSVMGHLAKSDGRVCEDEITMAEKIMERMQLSLKQKQHAIKLFNHGKETDFDLERILQRLKKDLARRALIRHFIDIQLKLAYSDGDLQHPERQLLKGIVNQLEFNRLEYEHLEREVKNELLDPSRVSLNEAYSLLGVQYDASDDELRTVYRRLMGQVHPDRLHANNLSAEELRLASERAHRIKTAYEQVKKVRGF
ncbi:MAG: co-chaperone DjlA [Gammaproteobacteria bacterium]|nr:co-chaperone DjlA [Gammaproteobacteria bacterium]